LLQIRKNRLLLLNLSFIFVLSSVWTYSKYETKYQVYYHNVKSIKNSFFEQRIGFNLSPKQIAYIGKEVKKDIQSNKTGKEIYYFARADVAFVLKYVYRQEVYWKGRRGYPQYEDFMKHIKTSKVIDNSKKYETVADYLKKHKDETIILSIKDEGSKKLSNATKNYLKSLGIHIDILKSRGSFVGIISNGTLVDYKIDNDKKIILASSALKKLGIDEVVSAGYAHGNLSKVRIDGKEYSKNRRGINIITIDKKRKITSTYADTHLFDAVGNISQISLEEAKKIIIFKIPKDFPPYIPYR
jgi:hypothetical protein